MAEVPFDRLVEEMKAEAAQFVASVGKKLLCFVSR